MRLLLRRLEIVNRLDSANDVGSRSDVLYDLLHALVSHRGLVEGIGDNAGGVDTCHLCLILSHGQPLEGGRTGHQASGTVRCRAVPILVALANADQGTVTHIDGNQELLACLSRNSALAEHHFIHIDVVVNGLESLQGGPAATVQNDLSHLRTISLCELPADIHIVEVVLHKGTVKKAKVTRERRCLSLKIPVQRLQRCLDLGASALLLVGADDLLSLAEIILLAYIQIHSQLLIKLGNLCTEITASGVDHQVLATIGILVDLDKVITAAERAQGSLKALGISERSVATQLCQVKPLLSALPNISAARNAMQDTIDRWTPRATNTLSQLKKLRQQIEATEEEMEDILMERIRDKANAQRYDRMIAKREEQIAQAKKKIAELENLGQTIRSRQAKLKKDISLIDQILEDGQMTEAHLRLLIEKIFVYETEGGLRLEIKIKAPFQNHTDTYENGVLTNSELEEIIQGVSA